MGRRKYRSQAEWSALIERQAQSGLSGSEFCKRHGLVTKCFYRKRRQLSDGKALVPAGRSFVQVSPESSTSTWTPPTHFRRLVSTKTKESIHRFFNPLPRPAGRQSHSVILAATRVPR